MFRLSVDTAEGFVLMRPELYQYWYLAVITGLVIIRWFLYKKEKYQVRTCRDLGLWASCLAEKDG